jgi:PAS domain S-box-containing protein
MSSENRKTLLLVEDEAIIAIAQKKTLEKYGYKVVTVNNGERAINVFRENDDIDLILMDIDLGKSIDGTETAKRILAEHNLPVVFLSSHTEPEIVEKTEKITSYGYVVKNSGITVLDASIKMAFKLFDANKQIVESEIKQKAMISNISDVIAIIGADGIMKYKSPNIEKLFGWKPEDLIGTDGFSTVHPDDLEIVKKVFFDLLQAENSSKTLEYRYKCKDGKYVYIELTAINLTGDPVVKGILLNYHDISERKSLEAALEKRMVALTRPLDQPEGIAFEDLFDQEVIQQIQDEFAMATGVASIITNPDGTPITKPSNFTRLCNDIIRCTETGRANCYKSDALLGSFHTHGPNIQPCLSGGLWDAGASISVGDRHIANWLIGQVRDETQSEEKMREYAGIIGADENSVIEAFREIPIMPVEQFKNVAQALHTLANQLSVTAYQNVQQARFITERKRIEEALRDSEERFRKIFDDGQVGIIIANKEFRFENVNPAFCRFTGYSQSELLSLTFKDITHPEYLSHDLENMNKLKNGEIQFYQTDKKYIRKSGEIFWGNILVSQVYDKEGKFFYYLAVVMDINERRKSDEALLKSEERYKETQRMGHVGSWEYNLQTANFWGSDEAKRIYGFDPEKSGFTTDEVENCIPDRVRVHQALMDLIEHGKDYNLEFEINPRNGGEPRIIWSIAELLRDEKGNPLLVTGLIQDITDRKHAEELIRIKNEELESLNEELNAAIEEMEAVNEELIRTNGELAESEEKLKNTMNILSSREGHLRTLLQTIPDLVWLKDKDGVYLSCNKMFERFFGAEETDITGKTDYDFLSPEIAEFFRRHDRNAMQAGKPTVNEEWITFADDGHRAYLETIKTPMYDEDGTLIGVLGIGRDISGRKRAEEELEIKNEELNAVLEEMKAANEELIASGEDLQAKEKALIGEKKFIEALLECIPGYLYVYDDKGSLIRWNKKHEEMTGYSAEELSHMNMSDWFEGEDAVRVAAAVDEVFRTGYGEVEANLIIKGGRKLLIHSNGVRLIIDGKNYFTGVGTDVTERRRLEEELIQSKLTLEAMLQTMVDGMVTADLSGRITYSNKAAGKILSIGKDVLGKDYKSREWRQLDENGDPYPLEQLPLAVAMREQREVLNVEHQIEASDGERKWLSVNAAPLFDDAGKLSGGVASFRDITESKIAEENIRKLLREKELLLHEVHHRIKNNMNTIHGLLKLQADAQDNPEISNVLFDAESRVISMMVLYDRLYRSDDFKSISIINYITALAEEILSNFPSGKKVKIIKKLDDFVLDVKILQPLGIIINELLTNIMKYAFTDREDGIITISSEIEGSHILINIHDNGVGIPETIEIENSTGFGMQLVGMLTEQIGGSIRIERKDGTKFILEFDV